MRPEEVVAIAESDGHIANGEVGTCDLDAILKGIDKNGAMAEKEGFLAYLTEFIESFG